MELSDAIKEVIGRFGLDVLKKKQFVNLLDDIGAFKDEPAASKKVMKELLDSGFGELLYKFAEKKDGNWQNEVRKCVGDYAAKSKYTNGLINKNAAQLLYCVGLIDELSQIDNIMSKRFYIEDEKIFCVDNDGSVTNIAIIDVEDGDIRPADNEAWYSELEDEIDDLKQVQDNHSKLLSLVTDTNKKITSTKSDVSALISAFNKGMFNRISHIRSFGIFFLLFIVLISGVIIAIEDFFPDIVPSSWMSYMNIIHVVLTFFAVISVTILIMMNHRQSLLARKIQSAKNSSEELSVIHCNKEDVYDFPYQLNLTSLPIIITDVLIGNTDNNNNIESNYGEPIFETNTMYLKPKVKYFGIKSGVHTLRVRWIKPDGSISKGKTSLGDFSQIEGYNISSGKNDEIILNGWGNSNKGHWVAGQYFIEIWYDEIRLIRKPFTIY